MNINITLLIQIVAFILLIWFIKRLLWAPVINVLEQRRVKISEGLSAAEKSKEELQQAEQQAKEVLQIARDDAVKIIDQAEKRYSEIVESAKEDANIQVQKIRHDAENEIKQELVKTKENLRMNFASLLSLGVKKIIAKEVNADNHLDVVESLIKKI